MFCSIVENEIREGDVDLNYQPWPSISTAARHLIKRMLNRDPKKRISAAEVLGKPLCL